MKEDRVTRDSIIDAVLYVQLWCKGWEVCTAARGTEKGNSCQCYHELREHIANPRSVADDTQRSDFVETLEENFWYDQFGETRGDS